MNQVLARRRALGEWFFLYFFCRGEWSIEWGEEEESEMGKRRDRRHATALGGGGGRRVKLDLWNDDDIAQTTGKGTFLWGDCVRSYVNKRYIFSLLELLSLCCYTDVPSFVSRSIPFCEGNQAAMRWTSALWRACSSSDYELLYWLSKLRYIYFHRIFAAILWIFPFSFWCLVASFEGREDVIIGIEYMYMRMWLSPLCSSPFSRL